MTDLLAISGERFEYETRMLIEAQKRGWPILSQPIATIYIEENASSHFRVLADSVAIYSVFLKYLFSSVVSFFCRCDRLCVIDPFLVCHRSVLHRDRFAGGPIDFGDRQLLHQS